MKDPFWRYASKLAAYGGGGGSQRWKCNFCGYEKTGSVTRVKDHLAHVPNKDIAPCDSVPTDVKASLEVWRRSRMGLSVAEDDVTLNVSSNQGDGGTSQAASKRTRMELDAESAHVSSSSASPGAKRTPLPSVDVPRKGSLQKASIQASFQKQAKKEATREITRLFIRCAIPFNVARTNQWKKTIKAISRIGCEWEWPSGEILCTRELKKKKACIEVQLESLKDTWKKYGCTILCDGWSDVRKRNVYNVLISCCKGTMFWKAIDASSAGLTVTGAFIWGHIKQVIQEIGPQNVVQVVTDNGSNCVAMGHMLEDEYPTIFWTPCASHSLDLLIEDVGKIFWVSEIFATAKSIVKFVTKRPKVLNMYRANSTLEILKPSKTRFAYMFIVLERLIRVRPNLIRTINCDEWLAWDEITKPKFQAFRRNIFNESWWGEVEALVKSLSPIYTVLRITDMEGSTLGLLYEYMDKIGEALDKNVYLPAEKVQEIRAVWSTRWDWFHAVAHVLHPLWRDEDQYESEELEEGFMTYVQRLANGDVEMIRRIEDDLLTFRNHSNHFGRATAKLRETQLQPVSWWEKYGNCAPTLKRIAIRVLSQDCSSGSCERNWSTWALFHTKKRNKLTTAQLERLVFSNCNLKLLERASLSPEPTQVNVDKIDIEKVHDIPDIPQQERDLYSMLYEEAIAPVHVTRAQGQRRRRATGTASTSQAAHADTDSSSSSSSEHSYEGEEVSESGSDLADDSDD